MRGNIQEYYTHVLDRVPNKVIEQDRVYLADDVDWYIQNMLHNVTPKQKENLWKRFKASVTGRSPHLDALKGLAVT